MKINIGGEIKKDGWKNLNVQKKPYVDIIGNIVDLSQFEDESIEEIYASHIVEHVDTKTIRNTFKGIFRVLKKEGGIFSIGQRGVLILQAELHIAFLGV